MTRDGLAILVFVLSGALAQDACLTSSSKNGICIDVRDCEGLYRFLKGPRPLSAQTLSLLNSNLCGYIGIYPKVCCEIKESTTELLPAQTPLVSGKSPVAQSETPDPPDVTNHPNMRLLPHDICGPVWTDKIFVAGGNKTHLSEFPWMALIAYNVGRGSQEFRCGGTLISKRYVLTAAHCVIELPNGLKLSGVRLGDHDISKERDCEYDLEGSEIFCSEKYQDFLIELVVIHPEYSSSVMQNDIALIRLNREADLRPVTVRPICLPTGNLAVLNPSRMTVSGWGATEQGGPSSQVLLQAFLSPVDLQTCSNAFRNRLQISYKQICAGGKKNVDSCLGDSGGPLQTLGLYNKTRLTSIQYGIVSYGLRKCGTEGVPGVYTKLTYYMDWILDNIRE